MLVFRKLMLVLAFVGACTTIVGAGGAATTRATVWPWVVLAVGAAAMTLGAWITTLIRKSDQIDAAEERRARRGRWWRR